MIQQRGPEPTAGPLVWGFLGRRQWSRLEAPKRRSEFHGCGEGRRRKEGEGKGVVLEELSSYPLALRRPPTCHTGPVSSGKDPELRFGGLVLLFVKLGRDRGLRTLGLDGAVTDGARREVSWIMKLGRWGVCHSTPFPVSRHCPVFGGWCGVRKEGQVHVGQTHLNLPRAPWPGC